MARLFSRKNRAEASSPEPGPELPAAEEVTTPPGEAAEAPPARASRLSGVRGRLDRLGTWSYGIIRRLPHLPLNTRRGVLLFALLLAGTAVIGTMGTISVIHYSESTAFCSVCHTMDPEAKGLAAGAHSNVSCAECHVNPGVTGFLKAKLNGTKQLVDTLSGSYPTPIPPPAHEEMPSTEDTCMECHTLEKITRSGGPTQLIFRQAFKPDEKNSAEAVALILRPAPRAAVGTQRGVHWHIGKEMTFVAKDEQAQQIDLIEYKDEKGEEQTYIAGGAVKDSLNAAPTVAGLKDAEHSAELSCITCHNRVGHPTLDVNKAVDESMAAGRIANDLPFIKRDAVSVLTKDYASAEAANKAFDTFGKDYTAKYTLLTDKQRSSVTKTVAELKKLYDESATPGMRVQGNTYADNLGHQNAPGCFRCHDGAHFKVVDGKVTTKTIPSTCNTCHTFPESGSKVADVPIGDQPADHADQLWVFNHQKTSEKPIATGTSCAQCHTDSYCTKCHDSGAIKVDHDTMLYNHAQSIRDAGNSTACAVCHQPAYCATCHKQQVMTGNPLSHLGGGQ